MNSTVLFLQHQSLLLSPFITRPVYSQSDTLSVFSSYFNHFVSSVLVTNNEFLRFRVYKCKFSKALQTSIVVSSLSFIYTTVTYSTTSSVTDSVFMDIQSTLSAGAIKMITTSASLTVQYCYFVNLSCQYQTVTNFQSGSDTRGGHICLFKGVSLIMNSCCYLNKLVSSDWNIHAITSICSSSHKINGFGFVVEGVRIELLIEVYHNQVFFNNINFSNVKYGVYCSWTPSSIEFNYIHASNSLGPLFLATTSTGTSKLTYANFLDSSITLSFYNSNHICRYLVFIRCTLTIKIYNSATYSIQNSFSDTQIHSKITVSPWIGTHPLPILPNCYILIKTPEIKATPQKTPQHTPQKTPQYTPQKTLQHTPQKTPQYTPPSTFINTLKLTLRTQYEYAIFLVLFLIY